LIKAIYLSTLFLRIRNCVRRTGWRKRRDNICRATCLFWYSIADTNQSWDPYCCRYDTTERFWRICHVCLHQRYCGGYSTPYFCTKRHAFTKHAKINVAMSYCWKWWCPKVWTCRHEKGDVEWVYYL